MPRRFGKPDCARLILGRPRGREDYRAAIQIYEKIAASSPEFIWLRAGLIATLQEFASLLTQPGDAVEARATFGARSRSLRS